MTKSRITAKIRNGHDALHDRFDDVLDVIFLDVLLDRMSEIAYAEAESVVENVDEGGLREYIHTLSDDGADELGSWIRERLRNIVADPIIDQLKEDVFERTESMTSDAVEMIG
jgi:hypothetical protein